MRGGVMFKLSLCFLAILPLILAVDAAGYTLNGTVYGGSNPLGDTAVTLFDAGTLTPLGTTTTSTGGIYNFTVTDGIYNLTVAPPSGSGFAEAVVNGIVVSGGDATQNIVLVPLASTISGRVRNPGGTGVQGVTVDAYDQASSTLAGSAVSSASGDYSIAVAAGTYKIKVYRYAHHAPVPNVETPQMFRITYLVSNLAVSGNTVQDINLPFATLSGKTKSSGGDPVGSVKVTLPRTTWYVGADWYEVQSDWVSGYTPGVTTSDAAGNYSITMLAHAGYSLTLTPPSGQGVAPTVVTSVNASADAARDLILQPLLTISGKVRNPGGTGVQGVTVEAYDQASSTLVGSRVSSANGDYSIAAAAGTYKIKVYRYAHHAPVPNVETPQMFRITYLVSNLAVSGNTVQDINLPFATLSGKTKSSGGDPVGSVKVTLPRTTWYVGADWYEVQSDWVSGYTPGVTTSDAGGNYSITMLAHAGYSLTLTPPSGQGVAPTVVTSVNASADAARDLVLQSLLTISGKVRNPGGTGVQGITVEAYDQGSSTLVGSAVSSANGDYSIALAAGTYKIKVYRYAHHAPVPNVGTPQMFRITYLVSNLAVSGSTVQDINLPFATLSGRTTDANGVPVGGVSLTLPRTTWYVGADWYEVQSDWVSGYTPGVTTSDAAGGYAMTVLRHAGYSETILPPAGSGFAQTVVNSVNIDQDLLQNIILDLPDTKALAILSGPTVVAITDSSAVIEWQTNEPGNGAVKYGTDSPPSTNSAEAGGYRTMHSHRLDALSVNTIYYVSVTASDEAANGPAVSGIVSFRTKMAVDVRPPVLVEGPTISNITHESAVVSWHTDEPTMGTVRFGETGSFGQTATDGVLALEHRVQITGLSPQSACFLVVDSSDAVGNGPVTSPIMSFHTVAAPDTVAPVIIEGPLAFDLTDTTATIAWTTDEPATNSVSWNNGTAYDLVSDPTLTTSHLVTLTNLTAAKTYSFTVSTRDAAGNGPTLSALGSFTTKAAPDTAPPVFTEITPVHLVNHQKAQLKWRTDEPSDSVVEYGLAAGTLAESESKTGLVTQHTIDLNHLQEDSAYFFRLVSHDERGNTATSAIMSFHTTAQGAVVNNAPTLVLAPAAVYISENEAIVTWETDVPTDTVVEYAAAGESVRRQSDAEKENKHQVTLTNLEPGKSYGVEISGVDGNGKKVAARLGYRPTMVVGAAGAFVPATTIAAHASPDLIAPVISAGPTLAWKSDRMAMVRWATDEISDSVVRYGLQGQALSEIAGGILDVAEHLVVLTNLSPATSYDIKAYSIDPSGNGPVHSGMVTFSTLSAPDSTGPQFTVSPDAVTIAADSAVIEWQTDEPATTEIRYGAAADQLVRQAGFTGMGQQHRVTIALVPCASYFFVAVSQDLAGNVSTSEVQSFLAVCPNRQPTDIALAGASVAEHQPSGVAVGSLSTTDPDTGNTFAYTLVDGAGGEDNGSFQISGDTLQTAAALDFETRCCCSVRVRTTDQDGLWFEKTFTIAVTDGNDAPTDIALVPASVPERQSAGTTVGTLGALDPNAGDLFTYTLVSGAGDSDNGSFTISGASLRTGEVFLFDAKNSYGIRVRATDQGGLWVEKEFTVAVTAVPCAFSVAPASFSFKPNAHLASIEVDTQPGCSWTAEKTEAWLSITAGSSGTGSGTIAFSVHANRGPASRSGSITVAGQSVTVTQGAQGLVASFVGSSGGVVRENPYGPAPLTVTYDAGGSGGPAAITNFHWLFGDGDSIDSATPTVEHTYLATGSRFVTLTVTDADGGSATAQRLVTVADQVHEVTSAVELQEALTVAQSNARHDLIRIAAGIYRLSENHGGGGDGTHFSYVAAAGEERDLVLEGGWAPDFSVRAYNLPTRLQGDLGAPLAQDGGVLLLDGATAALAGSLVVDGLTISGGNSTGAGGGMCLRSGGAVELSHSAIENNIGSSGGGVALQSARGVWLDGNRVSGNAGGAPLYRAGAGAVSAPAIHVSGNEISRNAAIGSGGLLLQVPSGGELIVSSNTISGNTTTAGGSGLTVESSGAVGKALFEVHNNILFGNTGAADFVFAPDCAYLAEHADLNMIGNDLASYELCADYPLDSSNVAVEPSFVTAGAAAIRLIAADTQLIDAGTAQFLPEEDFEGDAVPIDGGSGWAVPDIGADEFNPANPLGPTAFMLTPAHQAIGAAGGSVQLTASFDQSVKRDVVLYLGHADTNTDSPGAALATVTPAYLKILKGTSGAAFTVQALGAARHGTVQVTASEPSGTLPVGGVAATVTLAIDTERPIGTIAISGGAAYTTAAAVLLHLTAADTGGSGIDAMRFAAAGGAATPWEDYQPTKIWALAGGPGLKTVYAQFRDKAGNLSDADPVKAGAQSYSDAIIYDPLAPTGQIRINSGAAYTTSTAVRLNLWANDTGGSGIDMMRFQNNGGTVGTWEPYQPTKNWTLAGGAGLKTVYVQYRDKAGNISDPDPVKPGPQSYRCEIILDPTPPTGSIRINGGDVSTLTTAASLTITAADLGGSGIDAMRLVNTGGTTTPWEPWQATRSWTLTGGAGTKTVWVQLRDTAGNVSDADPVKAGAQSYSDAIEYTGP